MDIRDKKILISRYGQRLREFGYHPKSLGWGRVPQEARFKALTSPLLSNFRESVLDVGCGFADCYRYLKSVGWDGKYTGVDINPDILKIAQERMLNIDLRNIDVLNDDFKDKYDIVIACGVFNDLLLHTDQKLFIETMLKKMFSLCNIGLAVDFLSDLADIKNDIAFYMPPQEIAEISKMVSNRFLIRHDYLPYELCVCYYKNQTIERDYTFNTLSRQY